MEQGRATPARPPAELSEVCKKTLTFPSTNDAQKIVQLETASALNSSPKLADSHVGSRASMGS